MLIEDHAYFDDKSLFHGHLPLIMGTRLDLVASGLPEDASLLIWMKICSMMERLDGIFDRFSPGSEVTFLNRHRRLDGADGAGGRKASPEMIEAVRLGMDYNVRTCGLFDITRGYADCISVTDSSVSLAGEDATLDFGGFAKGYAARKIEILLREAGVTSALLDFGGSTILAVGSHPCGNCWKVNVADPFDRGDVKCIELRDNALSTSGNTPLYSGHIIDPRSGERINGRQTVMATSPDPLDAEILSTAMMMATESERNEILKHFEDAHLVIARMEEQPARQASI